MATSGITATANTPHEAQSQGQTASTAHATATSTTSAAAASEARVAAEKAAAAASSESPKPQRDPRSLQFQVQGTRIVTTVVDTQNNTVVEQIPDAEVIRLAAAIDRLKGFFLHEKA